ncbi:MAG: hypothetical protein U1E17_15900 [Geminicoccaceae bacterium]
MAGSAVTLASPISNWQTPVAIRPMMRTSPGTAVALRTEVAPTTSFWVPR